METQPKALNIDTLSKSDEKLSSSFIPRYHTLETSVKQASSSQTDYISKGRVLAENNGLENVMKCNYPGKSETMNLPRSSSMELPFTESFDTKLNDTELARSILNITFKQKFFSELLQEYIQAIESDNKSKNYEEPYSAKSSTAESSFTELLNVIRNKTKNVPELKFKHLSEIRKIYDQIIVTQTKVKMEETFFYMIRENQIVQEDILNDTIKNSKSNEKSKLNKSKSYEKSCSKKSSAAKSFPTKSLDTTKNRNKRLDELNKKLSRLSEIRQEYENLIEALAKTAIEEVFLFGACIEQIPQGDNLDNTTEHNENDEKSRDFQKKKKKKWQKHQKTDIPSFKSADASAKNLDAQKSTDSTTNIHCTTLNSSTSDNQSNITNEKYTGSKDPLDCMDWLFTQMAEDGLSLREPKISERPKFLQTDIMEKQPKSSNIDDSYKSDKKSFQSLPRHHDLKTFTQQASPKSSPMEQLNAIKNRNKRFHELYEKFEQLSEMRRKNADADSEEQVKAIFEETLLSRDRTEQMPRELNLNNTTESNENDEGSNDYQNKDKEMRPKIDEESFISANAPVAKESQSSQERVKKIESDSKSKNEESMELSRAEFSFAGSRNVYSDRFQEYLQNIHSFNEWYNEELDVMRKGIKDFGVLNLETSLINETYHKLIAMRASEKIKKQFLYEVCMKEIIQEDNLNSTSENSESNKKSKDNKGKNYEESAVDSSPPKSSTAEQLNAIENENKRLHELYEKFEQLSEVRKRYDDLVETHAKAIVDIFFFENSTSDEKSEDDKSETSNQLYSIESLPAESFSMEPANMRASVKIKKQFLYEIYMNQIIQEDNLNSTAENSESNEKLKDNKSENCKESYSTESSPSEPSSAMQLNTIKKRNKRLHELYELFEQLSKIRIIFDNITEREVKARIERILPFEARTEQISQKDNLYSTTENSKNEEKSKNYQNGEKENCHMDQKIDEKPSFRSTDAAVAKESQSSQKSQPLEIKEDAILMSEKVARKNDLNSMDENKDNKKPLDYQSTKNKICPFVPRKVPFLCLPKSNNNDNHKDNNTSIVGEWTKDFLDLNKIVQFLTEYHQQNSPLLKVVAFIDARSDCDKSYTVDIIRNSLRRRKINENFPLALYPEFIILKNLGVKHYNIKFTECIINFIKRFQKSNSDNRFTIITNFKVEHKAYNFTPSIDLHRTINTVKDAFIKANINIKVIPYKPLNKETLEEYISNTEEDIRLPKNKSDIIKRRLIENTRRKISNTKSCDPLNIKGLAVGRNKSRSFRTTPNSNDFGNESMTVTIVIILNSD
ncbi:myosin-J heavy chain-like [Cataglyphis hispanica]|uniref:myosin-J heavy chain-like n=1 Tax=Cataglyphis hispanica TaxID=1086592 RepID=UPI002180842C|nr:myosin-J heavy chain-like [Cataglyphis hispanica]